MYKNNKKILGLVSLWLSTAAYATPMNDYSFKSPSFNGNGYSRTWPRPCLPMVEAIVAP